jgi:hypothetical protein
MSMTKATVETLVDLVENKLAVLQIGDRDDLRQMVILQRCLSELRSLSEKEACALYDATGIPTRGRHRKMAALMEEMALVGERA